MSNSMSFGKPYILNIDGCIHDGWLYFKFDRDYLDIKFLYYLLSSKMDYFKSKALGSGVKNLNIDRVAQMPIAIPPTKEQKRIVKKLESLFDYCDNLEKEIESKNQNTVFLQKALIREAIENET